MGFTNFPHGVTSFGLPIVGGLPFHPKTRYLFVDKVNGGSGLSGKAPDQAFNTLALAHAAMADGYGDVAVVFPGSYAERLVPTKSHCKFISATPWMPELTQIVGDGTAGPTVDIDTAAQEGFMLYGFELDVPSGVEQPCLRTETDDAAASPAAGASGVRGYVGNISVRSNLTRRDPRCGVLIAGGTLLKFGDMFISGCEIGIGLTGSDSNNCSDVDFEGRIVFRDNVQADIATVNSKTDGATPADRAVSRIWFRETHHLDESGGVTRYLNLGAIAATRCMISDMVTAQDVADGTMAIVPAGWTFMERAGRNIAS